MKLSKLNPSTSLLICLLLCACGTGNKGQNSTPSTYETVVLKSDIPSPKKQMKGKLKNTTIDVVYGSPSVKGRTIWGDLVPYGKVWRTGANEATTIEVSTDVMVEGKKLNAGKYGLFTLPGTSEWTIIFNSVPNQWGAYDYDADKDVLRVQVKPKAISNRSETMEFSMEGSALVLKWDELSVPIQLKVQ